MGVAHEKAEKYEERGMFKEALPWHREDLAIARRRAQDGGEEGEDEDERALSLDLARALRNTGCCLGRLGRSGFTEVRWRSPNGRGWAVGGRRGGIGFDSCSAADVVFRVYRTWM